MVYVAVPSCSHEWKTAVDNDPWLSKGHADVKASLEDMPRGARSSDKVKVRRYLGLEDGSSIKKADLALSDKEFAEHVVGKGLRTVDALLAWIEETKVTKDVPVAARLARVGLAA